MTKIRETQDSSMIDDRRGQSGGGGGGGGGLGGLGDVLGRMGGGGGLGGGGGGGGGGLGGGMKMGGGLVGILVMLAVAFLPKLLAGAKPAVSLGGGSETPAANRGGTCDDELESILCGATIDVQTFWKTELPKQTGTDYEVVKTVFFSNSTDTGCGQASSQTGPFYCPVDHLVYFDLDFLVQLQNQFDAKGDLASQYIVAHEYGHHLQNILGTNAKVQQASQNDPNRANQFSVALELQADCFAGIWAKDAAARGMFESDKEIEEALNAAAAVGDDRIQMKMQGRVDPESFTHGTSEQRVSWFRRGYTTGQIDQCNTFAEV